jgi:hypothetical protein
VANKIIQVEVGAKKFANFTQVPKGAEMAMPAPGITQKTILRITQKTILKEDKGKVNNLAPFS